LSKVIRTTIRKGDFLTIADKVFEISVSDAAAQKEPDNVLPAAETKSAAQYTITCPKCGTVYEIENMDHRITECSNCDEYDKHEISGIRAKAKNAN
jgi:protein-arginine kinase activator protein McsA